MHDLLAFAGRENPYPSCRDKLHPESTTVIYSGFDSAAPEPCLLDRPASTRFDCGFFQFDRSLGHYGVLMRIPKAFAGRIPFQKGNCRAASSRATAPCCDELQLRDYRDVKGEMSCLGVGSTLGNNPAKLNSWLAGLRLEVFNPAKL